MERLWHDATLGILDTFSVVSEILFKPLFWGCYLNIQHAVKIFGGWKFDKLFHIYNMCFPISMLV